MKLLALVLIFATSFARAAETTAWVAVPRASVWRQLDPSERPFGFLKQGTPLRVLRRTEGGNFLEVEVDREGDAGPAHAFVLLRDLTFDPVAAPAGSVREDGETEAEEEDKAPELRDEAAEARLLNRPWSFGAGFSGYAGGGSRVVTVSADARHLWAVGTETVFGVDLAFGDEAKFGVRMGQRLYAPTYKYRPFLHLGWRISDVRATESAAWEPGAGLQILYGEGASFFEAGIYWLYRTPFDASASNAIAFGGSGGIRF